MKPKVRVVVSCSERKAPIVDDKLRLRNHGGSLETRSKSWLQRIGRVENETYTAWDLYRGEHWSVVKKDEFRENPDVELWVASAGYGLVRADEKLEPYAATFATGMEDSVVLARQTYSPTQSAQYWWQKLSERNARSLQQLAESDPELPILVALSSSYVRAVREDLKKATKALTSPTSLFLVTGGGAGDDLKDCVIPVGASFQQEGNGKQRLGGSRMSLNVRVAGVIIKQSNRHEWDRSALVECLHGELGEPGEVARFNRAKIDQNEVEKFIEGRFQAAIDSGERLPSKSTLLVELRYRSMACEQKRFGLVYDGVVRGRAVVTDRAT